MVATRKCLETSVVQSASLLLFLTYIAFQLGLIWPLGTVLGLIILLMISLVIALWGIKPEFIKVAGLLNILIGIGGLFIFWGAVTHGLNL